MPKIKCHIVVLADSIYEDKEESCEFLEDAILDTGYIVAANKHWDYTEIHYISGHSFVIDLDFDDFCKKWIK